MANQEHLPCPCGKSSDAFSIYEDNGWGMCFSGNCDKPRWSPEKMKKADYDPGVAPMKQVERAFGVPDKQPVAVEDDNIVHEDLLARGLTKATLKRYKVDISNKDRAIFPIVNTRNEIVAAKTRLYPKTFKVEGTLKGSGLWGRDAFPAGSAKAITVTEGYEDAMAVYQMTGSKFPAVSIHASGSVVGDCRVDFEYLNSFETIVFCFDNDEAGKKAATKAVENLPFPIGKVKVMFVNKGKDASDYLKKQWDAAFQAEWWKAETFKPDGLVFGKDLLEDLLKEEQYFMVDYPFKGLNSKTYGLRTSELTIIHAPPKVGKTSFVKHIEHKLLTDPVIIDRNYGIGFMHFEESKKDTGLGLISIHNGVPYHLPDVAKPEQEITDAFNILLNNNRVVIYDHFGSNNVDVVLAKVRHMAAMGCKYIVIDHLSIIVSDQSGDERKQLDEILTKLKTLTMELDLCVIAVIHENRQGEIRGTMAAQQLANIVIALTRNKLDADPWRANVTEVIVEDNRFCGRSGTACYLYYDEATARMTQITDEQALSFEAGGSHAEGF
jgi:twinkle protein